MAEELALVLSAEHAGRRVPARWEAAFAGASPELNSHRGWDAGSLELARDLAGETGAPLVSTTVTRLLADCNRSPGAERVFSEFTRDLPAGERALILERWHAPHRGAVEAAVADAMTERRRVLHVGVHSFTPVWKGRPRELDVGLLYDPRRSCEAELAKRWRRDLVRRLPGLRVHLNRPYRGWTDGLCTTLRGRWGEERYAGLELEMNQLFPAGPRHRFLALRKALSRSLLRLLR